MSESKYDLKPSTVQKIFDVSESDAQLIADRVNKPQHGRYPKEYKEYSEILKKLTSIKKRYEQRDWSNGFDNFVEWWFGDTQYDKHNGEKCFYCGITTRQLSGILKNNSVEIDEGYTAGTYHKSKKGRNSWNKANMEIDRKDPLVGYNSNNCVFACHLCNNAKTDIIQYKDFKDYFGESFRKYYMELNK